MGFWLNPRCILATDYLIFIWYVYTYTTWHKAYRIQRNLLTERIIWAGVVEDFSQENQNDDEDYCSVEVGHIKDGTHAPDEGVGSNDGHDHGDSQLCA